jgi:hypothetical protein
MSTGEPGAAAQRGIPSLSPNYRPFINSVSNIFLEITPGETGGLIDSAHSGGACLGEADCGFNQLGRLSAEFAGCWPRPASRASDSGNRPGPCWVYNVTGLALFVNASSRPEAATTWNIESDKVVE